MRHHFCNACKLIWYPQDCFLIVNLVIEDCRSQWVISTIPSSFHKGDPPNFTFYRLCINMSNDGCYMWSRILGPFRYMWVHPKFLLGCMLCFVYYCFMCLSVVFFLTMSLTAYFRRLPLIYTIFWTGVVLTLA